MRVRSGKIPCMTDRNADWIDLPDHGVLAVRGADARKFLNGQLSQQLLSLGAGETVLAGLHNPQGRTLAILRVVADGPQDMLCVLPRSLLEGVLSLLRKYLLRSATVEVAGRFIGQHTRRLRDQRTCQRHSLPLTTRQLTGEM